jgi:hypothetical protein
MACEPALRFGSDAISMIASSSKNSQRLDFSEKSTLVWSCLQRLTALARSFPKYTI